MHKHILTQQQIELLPLLKQFSQEFCLVGGTAIALYIGHRFIAGHITKIGNEIVEHIRSIKGKIMEDQVFQKNNLTIRQITAELPKHSNSIVSLFLQQLEIKHTEQSETSDIATISIKIYIIEKQ